MSNPTDKVNGANCRILVVEDETLIRFLLVDELESAGYSVVEAENADEAVSTLLGESGISAVMTDVRMPGSMDGLGLAAWMREHRSEIPIVITSGFATPPDIAAINPAIAHIVSKPYRACEAADWLRAIGIFAPA